MCTVRKNTLPACPLYERTSEHSNRLQYWAVKQQPEVVTPAPLIQASPSWSTPKPDRPRALLLCRSILALKHCTQQPAEISLERFLSVSSASKGGKRWPLNGRQMAGSIQRHPSTQSHPYAILVSTHVLNSNTEKMELVCYGKKRLIIPFLPQKINSCQERVVWPLTHSSTTYVECQSLGQQNAANDYKSQSELHSVWTEWIVILRLLTFYWLPGKPISMNKWRTFASLILS